MTQTARQLLLEKLPPEHRSTVEEIARSLKRALRVERLARQLYKNELRRVLPADEFEKFQLVCRAKIFGGGTPTEAKPGND
jgi:hypothetical protein